MQHRTDFGNVACTYKHLATANINFSEVLQKLVKAKIPEHLKQEFLKAYRILRQEAAKIPATWKYKSDEEAVAYLIALSCLIRRIRNIVERVVFEAEFPNDEEGVLIENAFYEDALDLVGNLHAAEKHLNDAATIIVSQMKQKGGENVS